MRPPARSLIVSLQVFALFALGPTGTATAEWQLTKIVDTTTPIPGTSDVFTTFHSAVIDEGTVGFVGAGPLLYQGLFLHNGTEILTVADTGTLVPGLTEPFRSLHGMTLDGGNVAFVATHGLSREEGIYTSIGGSLNTVVDAGTPIPEGTGNFTHFQAPPALDGTDVGFRGQGTGQDGIYTAIGGTVQMVADTDTIPPGGTEDVDWVWRPSFDDGHVAFVAWDYDAGQRGIYTDLGGTLHAVADQTTPIPGGTGTFLSFGWDVSLEGDRVAFAGFDAYGNAEQKGVYIYDESEADFLLIANQDTPIPGGIGNFTGFGGPSLSGDNLAFGGSGNDDQRGIYAMIDGMLTTVIDTQTALTDFVGYTYLEINFLPLQGLDGTSLAFWVRFIDESDPFYPEIMGTAVYRADWVADAPIPEPAVTSLLVSGLLSLAAVRRKVLRAGA